MTKRFDKDVQGVALYLEFRKPYATAQVLLTPDAFTSTGEIVHAQFFRRIITDGVQKRKWRAYGVRQTSSLREQMANGAELDTNEVLHQAARRYRNLDDYFASMARGGYILVNSTPIYVEITKADMDSIKTGTMPTKVWTRVKSSRAALGFPEELVTKAAVSI